MGLFTRKPKQTRDAGGTSLIGITLNTPGVICPSGYHPLMEAPEVAAAVSRISDMLGSMTIHEMQNTRDGDVRVRDALARKVDIDPWSLATRQTWVSWICSQMLTEGEAFVIPRTSGGLLLDLPPAYGARAQLRDDGTPYQVVFKAVSFDPDEVLHFRLRPDLRYPWKGMGPQLQLQAVVDSIIQTGKVFFRKHGSTILFWGGIGTVIGGTVLAAVVVCVVILFFKTRKPKKDNEA